MEKEDELCEGCGKIVSEIVLGVKHTEESNTDRTDVKFIYEFSYNQFNGQTCILPCHVLKETKRSYYIEDVHCKKGRRISKQFLDVFVDYGDIFLFNTRYPVMYSLDIPKNYARYIGMLTEYLQREINTKQEYLRQVKAEYERACEYDEERRKKKESG